MSSRRGTDALATTAGPPCKNRQQTTSLPLTRQLLQQLRLIALNFQQRLELFLHQQVHLLVQVADFDLGLEVDQIVIFRPLPVFFFLPVLGHHDDRRLNGGQAGQHQVEQDEREGVEGPSGENDVDGDPANQHHAEGDDKGPAAAEGGHLIRHPLPPAEHLPGRVQEVLSDEFLLLKGVGDQLVEFEQMAVFGGEDFVEVLFLEMSVFHFILFTH